jgi:TM2 domain-containing membrane protein YozV
MNNKILYILEIFWLIIAVLSLFAGIHQTVNERGIRHSWLFLLIALIGFSMFLLRRNLRKKMNR